MCFGHARKASFEVWDLRDTHVWLMVNTELTCWFSTKLSALYSVSSNVLQRQGTHPKTHTHHTHTHTYVRPGPVSALVHKHINTWVCYCVKWLGMALKRYAMASSQTQTLMPTNTHVWKRISWGTVMGKNFIVWPQALSSSMSGGGWGLSIKVSMKNHMRATLWTVSTTEHLLTA